MKVYLRLAALIAALTLLCVTGIFAQSVSVDFKDTPAKEAVKTLFEKAGVTNVVIDESVEGKVNMTAADVPFKVALKSLLKAGNLICEEKDGAYTIKAAEKPKVVEEKPVERPKIVRDEPVKPGNSNVVKVSPGNGKGGGGTMIIGGNRSGGVGGGTGSVRVGRPSVSSRTTTRSGGTVCGPSG